MRNPKAEKIWLCHHVAGTATADWLVGVRGRDTDIRVARLLQNHKEGAARQIWIACRGIFTFSPSRFFDGAEPSAVAIAGMANSFTALGGTAALANLFGDNLLPNRAVETVSNDLIFSRTQWQAITSEEAHLGIFARVWDATRAFFSEEPVRECVSELAALIEKTGALCNADGALDNWFFDRLGELNVPWNHFMPIEEVFREVVAAHHGNCEEPIDPRSALRDYTYMQIGQMNGVDLQRTEKSDRLVAPEPRFQSQISQGFADALVSMDRAGRHASIASKEQRSLAASVQR